MRLPALTTLALCALTSLALAGPIAPGPYYARGTFYCVGGLPGSSLIDSCWCYSPKQELFDDGLHGDGAAGDGVYGADIPITNFWGWLEFKIANADWTFNEPTAPLYPLNNGYLWPDYPGQVIHFTLDTSTPVGGWGPAVSAANDHGYPAGMSLEVIGSAPEIGNWSWGLAATHTGHVWSKSVVISTPGTYEYKFRCLGTWNYSNFGIQYNNLQGANASFTSTVPNEPILFQFDESNGRLRAVHDDPTATRPQSWGQVKAAYR